MKTRDELLEENRIIHYLISELNDAADEAAEEWQNWANLVDQERVSRILREIYTGMLDAAGKCTDAESKMLDKEAQKELDNALKNSAVQSNKDKAQIEKERKDKQSMIEQQMGEDMKGIETDNAEAMRESQEALKKAKEEWKKSIEEAKSKREASGTGDQSKISNIKDILKGVAPQLDSVKGKVEVAGSFYATSLLSLSAGGAAERTAKATEDIKKNTKKTNQILEKQSGDLTYE